MHSETTPRVLLVGCGPTALTALDSLAAKLRVVAVVRDHDPAAADGDPVCRRAAALGVPVSGDATVRGIERLIAQHRPDSVVVSSFNRVLPGRLVSATRFVNVHYAMLPRYRGRANVNWALINGESETGISVHVLAPGLDAGNILYQEAVPIGPRDTVTDLYDRLNALQQQHLGDAVLRHLEGDEGRPQDDAGASYGCTRLPQDGVIDWTQPTHRIDALVRALTPPYPGAVTFFGAAPLTVWRAEPAPDAPPYDGRIPGRVVRVAKDEGWAEVLTGDGVLRVHEVQVPGQARRPAAAVLTSVKHTLGLNPLALLERLATVEAALGLLQREREQLLAGSGA
jgi:methionyl-tRNA formyltransferase